MALMDPIGGAEITSIPGPKIQETLRAHSGTLETHPSKYQTDWTSGAAVVCLEVGLVAGRF